MSADIANHHPNWVESVKKRKIHENATKWTSALSPAPYVRLLTLRNFWEVMEPRQDLSWMSEDDDVDENKNAHGDDKAKKESLDMDVEIKSTVKSARQQSASRRNSQSSCVRIVKQYPCPGHFLKGLWEEELRNQRVRQMIPDTVRKPIRGKIYHAKPIMNLNKQNKPSLPTLFTGPSSSSNSSAEGTSTGQDNNMDCTKDGTGEAIEETTSASATSTTTATKSTTEFELSLKKKHRAAAIIRSKSKDECMRVLHRMREQLNIVINLQRQVSIELLLALYGPHFMQTSNFRAIEELLWGARGHSQQAAATSSSSIDTASSSNPTLVQT
ncbi:hypothetical protein BGW39_007499 [Mortierella sp. 14UC]|nr:hypothetical protein BGW39_007499 [Mortierella sp. 14UC]